MGNVSSDRLLRVLTQLDDLLALHHVRCDVLVHEVRQRVEQEVGATMAGSLKATILDMFHSVTDVYITRANGHRVDDEERANGKLAELRAELYRELVELNIAQQ